MSASARLLPRYEIQAALRWNSTLTASLYFHNIATRCRESKDANHTQTGASHWIKAFWLSRLATWNSVIYITVGCIPISIHFLGLFSLFHHHHFKLHGKTEHSPNSSKLAMQAKFVQLESGTSAKRKQLVFSLRASNSFPVMNLADVAQWQYGKYVLYNIYRSIGDMLLVYIYLIFTRMYWLLVDIYINVLLASDHNHRPSNEKSCGTRRLLSAVNVVVALCIRPDQIFSYVYRGIAA